MISSKDPMWWIQMGSIIATDTSPGSELMWILYYRNAFWRSKFENFLAPPNPWWAAPGAPTALAPALWPCCCNVWNHQCLPGAKTDLRITPAQKCLQLRSKDSILAQTGWGWQSMGEVVSVEMLRSHMHMPCIYICYIKLKSLAFWCVVFVCKWVPQTAFYSQKVY